MRVLDVGTNAAPRRWSDRETEVPSRRTVSTRRPVAGGRWSGGSVGRGLLSNIPTDTLVLLYDEIRAQLEAALNARDHGFHLG